MKDDKKAHIRIGWNPIVDQKLIRNRKPNTQILC